MRSRGIFAALVVASALCPWRAAAEPPAPQSRVGVPDRLDDGTWSVDEAAIRAQRDGNGLRVTVPVSSTSSTAATVRVSARIEILSGEEVAPWAVGAPTPLPGATPPEVLIPFVPSWVWDRPQGTVLVWSLAIGEPSSVLGGRLALDRAGQPLRVLVTLPSRLTQGVPVPFQATVTRVDGTAAAGARFVVRSGYWGGFQDWGGAMAWDAVPGATAFEGLTDALGVVTGRLDASTEWGAQYAFEAELDGSRGRAEQWLGFEAPAAVAGRLIAATDKPAYQPSQDVHVRVLALRPGDGRPAAGTTLVHAVRDPRGTLVHREELVVDRFGVTHFVFPLADELLLGEYRVEVTGDEHAASVPFTVDRYELPRFANVVSTDEPYVTPGGVVSGRVDVSYVFGEPVRGAKVTFDLLRQESDDEPHATDTGRTGSDGTTRFRVSAPSHFSAQELRDGTAAVFVRVRAVDPAEQTAETTLRVPVSEGPLALRVVPEAGELVAGIGNVIHVAVADPAGRPVLAQVSVALGGSTLGTAATDARGYARLLTSPLDAAGDLVVTASAEDGARIASRTIAFDGAGADSYLLARPDRSMTGVGEPLGIDILCSQDVADVRLDVRSRGELVESRSVAVTGGTARVEFVPTADAVGELSIDARALDSAGRLVQDRRTVVVDVGDALAVAVTPDRAQYQPGEPAALGVEVRDPGGNGVEAEVGITAVDEAVYLLTAGRAGIETLEGGTTGLDGTETFGGGASLGDLLAGGRAPQDQDLAAAILAARPSRGREADSRLTAAAREATASEWKLYEDGRRITALLRPLGRDERRAAIRSGRFVDPWGTPYDVSIQGRPREVQVTSAGADEAFGTADDLAYVYTIRRRSGRGVGFFGVARDAGDAGGPGGMRWQDGLFALQGLDAAPEALAPGSAPAAAPVQARRFFPETLLSVPDLMTDAAGRATLPFTLADNITTWRVAALASTQDGLLGSGTSSLRVVKDLFVDVGLPRHLTQGDRIEIPVVAYNLTGDDREVTLSLAPGASFESVDGSSRQLVVPAGSASRSSFGVAVVGTGDVTLRVDATGGDLTDAVEVTSVVAPDARPVSFTRSGQASPTASETVVIPSTAIAGQTSMTVHILPGVLSQTLDGLDALLAEPYGCFEQTTSTTYPNAVVLDYLEKSGTARPDVSARARRFLTQGVEKLLTFEVQGGGFSLWGNAPASEILSAYAVQEFEDIAKVRFVDPALIQRTAAWLVSRQDADGAWRPAQGGVHFGESTDALRITAYVAWVLADAGRAPAAVDRALAFVRAHQAESTDLYTRVVVANALLAADPNDAVGRTVFDALLAERVRDGRGTYWGYGTAGGRGMLTSSGEGGDVEATAMMVQALLATGGHADVISDVLRFLAGARSDYGGWGGTFATVWTIKAFVDALPASSGADAGSVEIRVNDRVAATVPVDPRDVPQAIDVSAFVGPGDNVVELVASGGAEPWYRISGRYMLPWSDPVPERDALKVSVDLGKDALRAGRGADLTLRIGNARAFGDAEQVTAVVALPPGFTVDEARLRDLRAKGEIDRFEVSPGRLNLYLGRIAERGVRELRVRVHPTLRGEMVLPHTTAYEYYDPGSRGTSRPRRLRVR